MDATMVENSVKQRAFELYINRGGKHGNDQKDWFAAEKEIRNQNVKPKPAQRPGSKS